MINMCGVMDFVNATFPSALSVRKNGTYQPTKTDPEAVIDTRCP